MKYDLQGDRDPTGCTFSIPRGQHIAGYAIGIMLLEVWYPLLPGNVVNATTYRFPVRHKRIRGVTQERIHNADPSVVDVIAETGQELQQEGVRAIVGACGYLGNYQKEIAAALDVPVFLSSLLQVPTVHRSLRCDQRVGIMCADGPALGPKLLSACGVTPEIPIAVKGLDDLPEFGNILYSRGRFHYGRLKEEVVGAARDLVVEYPDIGAILLECSDLPPFAWAIQREVKLPVFDFITMINWVYSSVVHKPYEGYC